uniref:Uncharacterized protein n=1 Tax=Hordeum vulgare subsp. vulgare TaxID=112509 RepID=A0A8I6Z718_HORVV
MQGELLVPCVHWNRSGACRVRRAGEMHAVAGRWSPLESRRSARMRERRGRRRDVRISASLLEKLHARERPDRRVSACAHV